VFTHPLTLRRAVEINPQQTQPGLPKHWYPEHLLERSRFGSCKVTGSGGRQLRHAVARLVVNDYCPITFGFIIKVLWLSPSRLQR
jgi:hypothetical protein